MRPLIGTLAPRETIITTVFKFVEQPKKNEKKLARRSDVKLKIMSLKVKEGTYYVPELVIFFYFLNYLIRHGPASVYVGLTDSTLSIELNLFCNRNPYCVCLETVR